jgi:hypothetical protein
MDESGPIWDGRDGHGTGYPHRSREVGGDAVQTPFSPVYSLYRALIGKNPWVGHKFLWEGDTGGVTNPKINPDYTLNVQDRYQVLSTYEIARQYFLIMWSARLMYFLFYGAFFYLSIICWYDTRREPHEIKIDRDEFFKNADLWIYGHDFDHHAYHHMTAIRRANKWGYYNVKLGPHGQVYAPEHLKHHDDDHGHGHGHH